MNKLQAVITKASQRIEMESKEPNRVEISAIGIVEPETTVVFEGRLVNEVLRLREVESLTVRQISKELDVSVQHVMDMIYAAGVNGLKAEDKWFEERE